MTLPVQSFNQAVSQQIAAMQSVSSQLLDFNVGSVLNALIEANAGNFLWLQAIATSLLAATRLATSTGNEVDTFIQDFGFQRFLGSAATGTVTFSRIVTNIQAVIPVGTIVSVGSANNLNFIVSVPPDDVSYPAYDPDLNAYIIEISTANANAYVQCQQLGTIGNVASGAIDTIFSSIVGVNSVNNASAFTSGEGAWSDAQTRIEFVLYIQSLSRATEGAIAFAVASVPGVWRFGLFENTTSAGDEQLGVFTVVVDGGTGTTTAPDILANVENSVDEYRGFTIEPQVISALYTTVNITMDIELVENPTETEEQITANIDLAIRTYINILGFENILYISRLLQLTYDADPNILHATTMEINGVASNLPPLGFKYVFYTGTVVPTYF